MKKLIYSLCFCLFLGMSSIAQNPDYVKLNDFQVKTQSINAQVKSIKSTNSNLLKDISSVKSSVEGQQQEITALKTTTTGITDSLKSTNDKIVLNRKQCCLMRKQMQLNCKPFLYWIPTSSHHTILYPKDNEKKDSKAE